MSLPIKLRLTAWYITLLALILVALGAFLLVRLRTDLVAAIDHSLDSRAAQISLNFEQGGSEGEFQGVSDASLVAVPRGETADQILSASGRVLQAAGDEVVANRVMIGRVDLARVLSAPGSVRLDATLGRDHEPFRVLAVRLPHRHQVLVVTESLEEVDRSVHRLLMLMLLAGPPLLAVAAGGGWWLSRKALRPVSRMTEEAAAIGVERLDERVAVPNTSDELERLGRTLDAMLGRLERRGAER